METNSLKRKNRSPNSTNAFPAPRPKKQRTKSPKPNSSKRNFRAEIAFVYHPNGTIPESDLIKSKRIEMRVPISMLSFKNNINILGCALWGGGHINNNLYTSDSDIVCILYHLGIISIQYAIDPFAILNKSLSQNMNKHTRAQNMYFAQDNDYNFMYVRTSNHKLNNNEIKQEQNRNLTHNKLYQILGNNDVIGIAVIFDIILKKKDTYFSVNKNGYYSRKWFNKNKEITTSLRLKYVYPLTNFNEFVIDNTYLFQMKKITTHPCNNQTKNKNKNKNKFIKKMDTLIAFQLNHDNRACLKYNISVISNAHLLINQIDWKNEQKDRNNNHNNEDNSNDEEEEEDDIDSDDDDSDEKRYGHLLQFRLLKFILMMENNKCQYQLVFNTKANKYKFIKMEFQNQRKQRHHNKIADDLNWNELKWSNQGVTIKDKLHAIHKVWLIKK